MAYVASLADSVDTSGGRPSDAVASVASLANSVLHNESALFSGAVAPKKSGVPGARDDDDAPTPCPTPTPAPAPTPGPDDDEMEDLTAVCPSSATVSCPTSVTSSSATSASSSSTSACELNSGRKRQPASSAAQPELTKRQRRSPDEEDAQWQGENEFFDCEERQIPDPILLQGCSLTDNDRVLGRRDEPPGLTGLRIPVRRPS